MYRVPLDAVRGDRGVRRKLEERLGYYTELRKRIFHPAQGMERKGFSQKKIAEAVADVDGKIAFYLKSLEQY